MTSDDIEEIKKLPPKERLKRLKELEAKRKEEEEKRGRESKEAKELLDRSLDEIKTQQILENIDVPEGDTAIEQILEQEDQEELEKKIKQERERQDQASQDIPSQYNIERLTSYETYNNLQRWLEESADGRLSEEYDGVLRSMYGEINMVRQMVRASDVYHSSKEVLEKLDVAKDLLKKIGYNQNILG